MVIGLGGRALCHVNHFAGAVTFINVPSYIKLGF